MAILTPYIPTYITVHLGAPSAQAENVTLSFHDYVKNVACSEIYPTWEENALRELGRALRFAPAFPKGANVSFVRQTGKDALKAVTFERGVEDFTLACGTGCGSIVSAMTLLGLVSGQEVSVDMPGGRLSVSVTAENGAVRDIFLTGPTCVICEGELSDEALGF